MVKPNNSKSTSLIMPAVTLLIFLAIVAIDIWAAVRVIFKPARSGWHSAAYRPMGLLALVATFVMTGVYSYYANLNKHVFGWPIPRVVFQRTTPDSPWLDFIGPTVV